MTGSDEFLTRLTSKNVEVMASTMPPVKVDAIWRQHDSPLMTDRDAMSERGKHTLFQNAVGVCT